MVLKTEPDRLVRPVQPSTSHHSGPIQSFDRIEIEPELNRSNRQFNRWTRWTSRFQGNRPVQMTLIFFFFKLQNENITLSLKEGFHRMLGLSYDTAHIPIPLTVSWVLSPQDHLKPLLRMAFIGVIWLLVPLIFRCGIAKYQRKKT